MAASKGSIEIIAGCFMIAACILYIVSNGVPLWGIQGVNSYTQTLGLWRECGKSSEDTVCTPLQLNCSNASENEIDTCQRLMVARAFIIMACIISAFSIFSVFACALIERDIRRILVIISKILIFLSFVVGIIGLAVAINFVYFRSQNLKIGDSAIVAIIGVSANALAAIMCLAIS